MKSKVYTVIFVHGGVIDTVTQTTDKQKAREFFNRIAKEICDQEDQPFTPDMTFVQGEYTDIYLLENTPSENLDTLL